jgi:glycosyltransferase involved in cell wall biosynthesis
LDFQLKNIQCKNVGWLSGHLWEQLFLPLFSFKGVLLNLCNTAPILSGLKLVVIHDASVFAMPHCFSLFFRLFYRFLWSVLVKTSKAVVTVSRFSQSELAKYCRVSPQNITVIPCGRDIKGFPYDIVIAGGTNARVFKTDTITMNSGKIKQLGYVTDEELKALYENAGCFVYPSLYEGFGLPPLEAMSCGCPVIMARSSSLPEVGGESVVYCDPHSHLDIAAKIEMMMSDEEMRKKYSRLGLQQAEKYSWKKAAKSYFEIIEKMANRI